MKLTAQQAWEKAHGALRHNVHFENDKLSDERRTQIRQEEQNKLDDLRRRLDK